jgi:hypothetical protein
MLFNPDFKDMLSELVENDVKFLIIGAYALAVHGYPRATGDMDIWIRPKNDNARRTYSALASFGAPLTEKTYTRPRGLLPKSKRLLPIHLRRSFDREASKTRSRFGMANTLRLNKTVVGILSFIRDLPRIGHSSNALAAHHSTSGHLLAFQKA